MSFPYHTEPDGNRFAPHHNYTGLLVALVGLVTGASGLSLSLGIVGALVGIGAMLSVWKDGSADAGALLTVGGGIATLAAGIMAGNPVVIAGALIALDDSIQHATGVVTPLDWLWKHGLKRALFSIPGAESAYKRFKRVTEKALEKVF